jgi:hypothetical protein
MVLSFYPYSMNLNDIVGNHSTGGALTDDTGGKMASFPPGIQRKL